MKLRPGPLIAILLLIGMGGWVYWVEFRGADEHREAEEAAKRAVRFEPENVAGIRIERQDKTIEIRREGEAWSITEPLTAPADTRAVEGMITSLETARIERRLGAETDLKSCGLEPPKVRVTLELASGDEALTLAIGDSNRVGGTYFAMLPGDGGVALVSAGLGSLVDKDVLSLRDRSLLTFDPWKVTHLRINRGRETIALARPDTGWQLEQPVEGPADGPAVTEILAALDRLRVAAFAMEHPQPSDLSRYGLEPPLASISIRQPGWDTEKTILFGKEAGSARYARTVGRDPAVTVPGDVWDRVNTPLADFRRTSLMAFSQYRIRSITAARSGAEALVLTKEGDDGWTVTGRAAGHVTDESVDALLRAIAGLEAVAFEDRPSRATIGSLDGQPSLDLTLEEEPGGEGAAPRTQRLQFGAPDSEGRLRVRDPVWTPLALVEATGADPIVEQLESIAQEASAAPPASGDATGDGETRPVGS